MVNLNIFFPALEENTAFSISCTSIYLINKLVHYLTKIQFAENNQNQWYVVDSQIYILSNI